MRRVLALLLSMALLLPGCASMLERDHLSVSPHVNQTMLSDNPSILRAENYQGLVNGVLYFVSQGMESGTIRLTKYTGDPEVDLAAVSAEVQEEDPLGAYALEGMEYAYSLIVSYYECSFTFAYRRTAEQLDALRTISGSSAIRAELKRALQERRTETAFRASSYYAREDTLRTLLDEAYRELGLAALGMPEVELTLYPQLEGGSQRIAELAFTFEQGQLEAEEHYQANVRRIQELAAGQYGSETEAALAFAGAVTYLPDGPSSTYAALSGDGADSLGVALACQAACEAYGLTCQTVTGRRDGLPHSWNVVRVDGVYRHMDAAREPALLSDDEMTGYHWDRDAVPPCPAEE